MHSRQEKKGLICLDIQVLKLEFQDVLERIFGELKAKQMHLKNALILQVSMVELVDAGMIQNTKFNCKRNKKLVSLMVSPKDSSEIYLRKQA